MTWVDPLAVKDRNVIQYSCVQVCFYPCIECCRDDVFCRANPEVSIALVTSERNQRDFFLGFWIFAKNKALWQKKEENFSKDNFHK